jgi:hypothetical protein
MLTPLLFHSQTSQNIAWIRTVLRSRRVQLLMHQSKPVSAALPAPFATGIVAVGVAGGGAGFIDIGHRLLTGVRRQRRLVRRRHENWSTTWSEAARTTRGAQGRPLWSRWCWRRQCRPLRTWRRCDGYRQQAGAGGESQENCAARSRRCASTCGRVAGSPTASPDATRFSMATGSGCGSGFWPTAAMPMWCGRSWPARRESR